MGSKHGSRDRLNMDVWLSWDLDIDIRLSWDLDINVGLSRDLLMDIRLSSILFMNVRLGSILLVDVGLGSGVQVGIGYRGVIGASIDSGIDGSRGSCCWEGSIACRVARVGSVGTSIG